MSRTGLPPPSAARFEVIAQIASGGMGRVDLARLGDSLVAVKRLHAHLSEDTDLASMFLDEVWLTGALEHPNVVRLMAWGHDAQGLFLAMELVHGIPLSHALARCKKLGEPFPVELAVQAASRVAAGLSAAHALTGPGGEPLGVVHRDVTPSNILISFRGEVKLTDFGVAKATRHMARARTATGVLKGKVPYMSPEYALGGSVDGRSDLYSVGVVLFELLTGSRPFDAETDLALLRAITEEVPPRVDALRSDVDAELASLVARLLAKSPADRPESAAELCALLDAWLTRRGASPAELEACLGELVSRLGSQKKSAFDGWMSSARTHKMTATAQASADVAPERIGTRSVVATAALEPTSHTREVSPPAPRKSPLWLPLAAVSALLAAVVLGWALFRATAGADASGPARATSTATPTNLTLPSAAPAESQARPAAPPALAPTISASAARTAAPGGRTGPRVQPPPREPCTVTHWNYPKCLTEH